MPNDTPTADEFCAEYTALTHDGTTVQELSEFTNRVLEALREREAEVEHTKDWYSVRIERLRDLSEEHDLLEEFSAIVANGTATPGEAPTYARRITTLEHERDVACAERDRLYNALEELVALHDAHDDPEDFWVDVTHLIEEPHPDGAGPVRDLLREADQGGMTVAEEGPATSDEYEPPLHERLRELADRPELATPLADAFLDCAGKAKQLEAERDLAIDALEDAIKDVRSLEEHAPDDWQHDEHVYEYERVLHEVEQGDTLARIRREAREEVERELREELDMPMAADVVRGLNEGEKHADDGGED